VVEAMWKRRPVVASRVGGIVEQIVHEESGLLLDDPADLAGFGRLVGRALSDRELAQRLGAKAYERARDDFLCLRHLVQYADLLLSLLK
jgi:trehalose synthase